MVQSPSSWRYWESNLSDEDDQLHAIVRGRVQGVSFRYYTMLRARELHIQGWVRNLPDGTVEVLAEGARARLDQLAAFLAAGPVGARVESVDANWQRATGQFTDFIIR